MCNGCAYLKQIDDTSEEEEFSAEDVELSEADEVDEEAEEGLDDDPEKIADSSGEDAVDPFADLDDQIDEKISTEVAETPEHESNTKSMASYTVKRGDTLMKIAFMLYGDISRWHDLYSWNQGAISSYNNISVGMVLKFEDEGRFSRQLLEYSYLIQRGDTLGGIAQSIYGRMEKWRKLQDYNRRLIKDPNRIYAGFLLYYEITPEEKQEAQSINLGTAPAKLQENTPEVARSAKEPAASQEPTKEPATESPIQQ